MIRHVVEVVSDQGNEAIADITVMYDIHGKRTTNPLDAVSLAGQLPDGLYFSMPCVPDCIHTVN